MEASREMVALACSSCSVAVWLSGSAFLQYGSDGKRCSKEGGAGLFAEYTLLR